MLTLPSRLRFYLATSAVDLRRGYRGLSVLVEHGFGLDPLSGDVFVFLNRRGTQVKMLFWDRDGYCIVMKRLEAGTFRRVKTGDGLSVEIDAGELSMLLEGYEGKALRRRKRYRRPEAAKAA